ncbi:MAG TPA: tetratricopeptide repeat protein [Ferruginibacter sp.]|nr:tetratricopeptide repeat protein [Ferruginibacter sp.]HMP21421.1 tetratricopeptide repeat protein [Ferruginibacter sp.]
MSIRDSLLQRINAAKNDSNAVHALYAYGELFESNNSDSAAHYYHKARALAQKIGYKKGVAAFASHYIVLLNNRGNFKEALGFAQEALEIYKTTGGKKDLATAYLNVGSEWQYLSDFTLAADYYLQAKKLAEEINDQRLQRISNNNLASVFIELQEFEKGKQYAEKSLLIAKELKNEYAVSSSMYNIATAYMHLGQYNKALELYKEIEASAQRMADDMVRLDGWLGLADAYSALGNGVLAGGNYNKVIEYAQKNDIPEYHMYACMGMADLLIKTKPPMGAKKYIDEGIAIAARLGSKLELKDLYLKASEMHEKAGMAAAALEYRKKFELLNDSIIGEKSKMAVSNLEAKYEFEKKESTIKQLTAENQLKSFDIGKKNTLNYILFGGTGTLLLILILSYTSYTQKQKLQQQRITELEKEKQLAATEAVLKGEEQERTRLAKDLHDGLGGMLSGIKYSMLNMKQNLVLTAEDAQHFERSMDMLDSSIQEMRRLAHNLMPAALVKFGLDTALKDLCNDINQNSALKITYQSIGIAEAKLSQTTTIAIYRIVQELLNNILKHAAAANAIVQLTQSGNAIAVTVEDDGKGFDTTVLDSTKGIGWVNIRSRVDFLKGRLDIHAEAGKGTSVFVELTV